MLLGLRLPIRALGFVIRRMRGGVGTAEPKQIEESVSENETVPVSVFPRDS
jgi:hypothetical protein